MILLIVIGVMLLITSIIDIKFKAVPSVILTSMILILLVLRSENLNFGILGFIMALLLYEFDYFSGIADIKVFTAISLMIPQLHILFGFLLVVVILGLFLKGLIRWKFKDKTEFAFLPVFFIAYIVMCLVGGIE